MENGRWTTVIESEFRREKRGLVSIRKQLFLLSTRRVDRLSRAKPSQVDA